MPSTESIFHNIAIQLVLCLKNTFRIQFILHAESVMMRVRVGAFSVIPGTSIYSEYKGGGTFQEPEDNGLATSASPVPIPPRLGSPTLRGLTHTPPWLDWAKM